MAVDQPQSPESDGSDGDGQPQIVVDDPQDFAKTRQLRAIFDARDDYIQARRDANRDHEDGELSFTQKNRRIFRHLQDLAMTMEPLLKSRDEGRDIWDDRTYGIDGKMVAKSDLPSFREAKRSLQQLVNRREVPTDAVERLLEQYEANQQKSMDVFGDDFGTTKLKRQIRSRATDWGWSTDGLGSLVASTPQLAFPVENGQKQFGTTAPPQQVSDAAFRDLQDFIRQVGLGVQFDEEQQTKIDDDLLHEVDEWRQKNIN